MPARPGPSGEGVWGHISYGIIVMARPGPSGVPLGDADAWSRFRARRWPMARAPAEVAAQVPGRGVRDVPVEQGPFFLLFIAIFFYFNITWRPACWVSLPGSRSRSAFFCETFRFLRCPCAEQAYPKPCWRNIHNEHIGYGILVMAY